MNEQYSIIQSIKNEIGRVKELKSEIQSNNKIMSRERHIQEKNSSLHVLQRTLKRADDDLNTMKLEHATLEHDMRVYATQLYSRRFHNQSKKVKKPKEMTTPVMVKTQPPAKVPKSPETIPIPTPQKAHPTPPVDPAKKPKSGRNRRRGKKEKP